MLKCNRCKKSFDLPSKLSNHVKNFCKLSSAHDSLQYLCDVDGCLRHFSSASNLKKHITRIHRPKTISSQDPSNVNHSLRCDPTIFGNNEAETDIDKIEATKSIPSDEYIVYEKDKSPDENIEAGLSDFFSTLYSNPLIPRNFVETVASGLNNFFSNILQPGLQKKFLRHLPQEEATETVIQALNTTLEFDFMEKFSSEFKRFNYFESLGTYIAPYKVEVGVQMQQKSSGNGSCVLEPTHSTMQVVPISKVLTNFFSCESVLRETMEYLNFLNTLNTGPDDPLTNIMHGSVWRKMVNEVPNKNPGEVFVPLVVYFDDYETGNPLGSHAGIHKLGTVYASLPFLPLRYASALKNIFLLAVFHAEDRIEFGNAIIFGKVIEELNLLHDEGIYLKSDFFNGKLRFLTCAFTGDNLGLNGALGFVESFNASRCCRVCLASKSEIQTLGREDESLLRDSTTYSHQLLLNSVTDTGIKERCVWLSLRQFNLFENVAMDLLHDWLEGCCSYVMTYVAEYLITETKAISVSLLNKKIFSFNFGADSNSKPVGCFSWAKNKLKIKTSASEMLVLVRYFGILVGEFVPENNQVWSLYICLRQITDRLLSSRVYVDTTIQLQNLIENFNELYHILTGSPLKPKFHFLVHYPRILKNFGPLTQIWTMRFEARHRLAKLTARTSCNRTNLCKTIAIKNQLVLNDVFLKKKNVTSFKCGKKIEIFEPLRAIILREIRHQKRNLRVYSVPFLKSMGTTFKVSSIVTLDLDENLYLPIFGQITKIFVSDDNVIIFQCSLFETVNFNTHFFAFEVERTHEQVFHSLTDLQSRVPNTLSIMMDNRLLITQIEAMD